MIDINDLAQLTEQHIIQQMDRAAAFARDGDLHHAVCARAQAIGGPHL